MLTFISWWLAEAVTSHKTRELKNLRLCHLCETEIEGLEVRTRSCITLDGLKSALSGCDWWDGGCSVGIMEG